MRLPISILTACFSFVQLAALDIEGYSVAANDRFGNNPAFIAHNFELSGVAISSDGRWATMISPNVFLTAWHFTPGTGQTLTFYATNDSTGPSVTRTVSSTRQQIGTSDLRAVVLDTPLPEGYVFYNRETAEIPGIGNIVRHPYWQKELFHFGRSPTGYTASLDVAVGKNVVDQVNDSQTVSNSSATGPSIGVTADSEPAAVDYETYALNGDSGAPLMILSNGNLKLIGITWFQTTTGDPPVPFSTGFSPVGDHNTAITTFLNTHSLPYQPLPPQNLTASRISATRVTLSWTDASDVESAYILEKAESAVGPWTALPALASGSENYDDLSAPSGDVYYRLLARNDSDSDWVEVSVLTPYGTWAAQFDWGSSDQSPEGDANGDGTANMVAYSMDVSPVDPLPVNALPYLESSTDFLDYFYRKNSAATDLTYTLNQSPGLINPDWQFLSVDGSTVTATDMGAIDSARLIRVRIQRDLLPNTSFFQLEIDSNDPP